MSLCSINLHAPMANGWKWSMAPHILYLVTKKGVFRQFHPSVLTVPVAGWAQHSVWTGWGIEPSFFGRPASILITKPTVLSSFRTHRTTIPQNAQLTDWATQFPNTSHDYSTKCPTNRLQPEAQTELKTRLPTSQFSTGSLFCDNYRLALAVGSFIILT